MRIDPLNFSPRVAGLTCGLAFAVVMGLVIRYAGSGSSWIAALVTGLAGGLILGLTIWLSVRQLQRRLAPAISGLSRGSAQVAYKAALGGPVPADPETRAAALKIAERQLALLIRFRVFLVILTACLVLSVVLGTLGEGPWWKAWPGALVLVGVGMQFYQPRLLRRRIALLRSPAAD